MNFRKDGATAVVVAYNMAHVLTLLPENGVHTVFTWPFTRGGML